MRNSIKKLVIPFIAFSVCFQTAFASFPDVVERSLFYDAVQYFSYDVPIISLEKEAFNPLDKVNKAEFFKLLILSGNNNIGEGPFDLPYEDINGDEWFAPYIYRALELNLISFDENQPHFHPGDTLNRAEGLNYMLLYYGIDADTVGDIPLDYTDVQESDYFADESQIAYMFQMLSDYRSRQFRAYKELSRAQTVHMLYGLHQAGFTNSVTTPNDYSSIREEESYELFLDVYNTILEDYIDKDLIDKEDLIYGAISGMVMSLSDPYSTYILPQDATTFQESLSGSFDGIGVYLNYENGNYIIQTPLKGSPAEEAGLKANDIITHIDGTSTTGMTFDIIVDLLRGPSGTPVTLTIKRNSIVKDYTITRALIDVPFVEGEMINGVAVIHYYQFTSNSNYQFIETLNDLLEKNPKGIVIDLRNNPGGYLYSSQLLASRFLPQNDPFVKVILADGYAYNEISYGPGDLSEYNTVVLINEGSASASEIVALALQEQAGAKIVGMPSFGKAKIQELISYRDGSSLKLSIAKWTSPNGVSVENTGVIPDFTVSEDAQQLNKAISLAAR